VATAGHRNRRWRHNFRQEYVTAKPTSKLDIRHSGKIVIKILQFLGAAQGTASHQPAFNSSNRRHARVKTRTTAP
jgi:hypothetical protein